MKFFSRETPDEVIRKVNLLLKQRGLWFEDDGQKHDDHVELTLKSDKCGVCNRKGCTAAC